MNFIKAKQITHNVKRLFGEHGKSADNNGLNAEIKNIKIYNSF